MEFTALTAGKTTHVRFLRYLDRMLVPDGWKEYITHADLLHELRHSHSTIDTDLRVNPDRFDVGFFYHDIRYPDSISITGTSMTLRLPARGHILTAREYTAGLIRRICPSHVVDSRTD